MESIYQQEHARLWRALLAFTGDPDIAEDVVAETFAQAIARGDAIATPEAWIWRAAFRIASGEMKRRSREKALEWAPQQVYRMPEPVDHIVRALAALPTRQRTVLVLHDYADRPAAEIAATLGMSRATVYVHLTQGRRKLRQALEAQDA